MDARASPGLDDTALLRLSVDENRILVSEDRDFGELIFNARVRAIGVVLVKIADFGGSLSRTGEHAADRVAALGESLTGNLTVIEPGRERVRPLPGVV